MCIILKRDFKLEDTGMFINRELEKAFLDANDFFSVLLLTGLDPRAALEE